MIIVKVIVLKQFSIFRRKGWFGTLKGMMGIGTKNKQEAKPEMTCEDGSSSGSYLDSIIASVLQSKMFKVVFCCKVLFIKKRVFKLKDFIGKKTKN